MIIFLQIDFPRLPPADVLRGGDPAVTSGAEETRYLGVKINAAAAGVRLATKLGITMLQWAPGQPSFVVTVAARSGHALRTK